MDKISTFLWFDGQAEEAAEFYTALFPDSRALARLAPARLRRNRPRGPVPAAVRGSRAAPGGPAFRRRRSGYARSGDVLHRGLHDRTRAVGPTREPRLSPARPTSIPPR
ncbi:MAG: VOC family protein [Paracoccus sp. (in: a-proteobacteria)]|uniref:VOC family protein n=1 Tax=Paracoccus sp. TaxID=267 RepID=UPI00391991FF